MNNNIFLKLISSIPVILLSIYFVPFLGVCLIILRYFVYNNKKIFTPSLLIILGLLLLIPRILNELFDIIDFDSSKILYFNNIVDFSIYNIKVVGYAKTLLIIGVIFLIITLFFNSLLCKLEKFIYNYICISEEKNSDIREKNDLLMKEKRERAKNFRVVYCPKCGADNILTSNVGVCKYCRSKLEVKDNEK